MLFKPLTTPHFVALLFSKRITCTNVPDSYFLSISRKLQLRSGKDNLSRVIPVSYSAALRAPARSLGGAERAGPARGDVTARSPRPPPPGSRPRPPAPPPRRPEQGGPVSTAPSRLLRPPRTQVAEMQGADGRSSRRRISSSF